MVLSEREKRIENEIYAREFESMKKVNLELISKCRVLEKQVAYYYKALQKLSRASVRNSTEARDRTPDTKAT